MTQEVQITPTYCCRCQDPILPEIRKVFFSDPYPTSLEEAMKKLPDGTVPIASHWNRKPVMDRHGNVFDYDPESRMDFIVTWDGKTYGHDGYCGPCHVQLEDEAEAAEAGFRAVMAIEDAKRRRLWHGLPRIKRAIALMRNDHIRKWYSRQRAEGHLAHWLTLDRTMPGHQPQAQQPAEAEQQTAHVPQAAE